MNGLSKICKKRIIGDIRLLQKDPLEDVDAYPSEDNMLEWHFLIRGPDYSDYKGGCYIGRIKLRNNYPLTPPDISFLTPNGRFDTNKVKQ